ncbi:Pentulose kinase [Violaceomyces palustris]|uniref:Pentulose kinase n=1 Tax=Violaceomyces palustris TaxID=1673888 RepID=A0ACD0NSA7_9BASI|nr:Pentulose kinase [Violaceomyces palustris]
MAGHPSYYIGVDVGTGSARAALVDQDGNVLSESTYNTTTYRLESDSHIFEQSTLNIWSSICSAVKDVVAEAKVAPEQVRGIGFDATCSLAVVDRQGRPISVTPGGGFVPGERNIILWADHRAEEEAKLINGTGHMVLDYVGKTMSLEMEIPKVLWLKRHMPSEVFADCQFFDLPDYLTFKATGSKARSNCSLVCKCSYVPPGVDGSKDGWQASFFETIGLEDMVKNDFEQLGGIPGKNGIVLTAGQPVGEGLTLEASEQLGLKVGTPVGSALIDAYAGWVGTVAAPSTNSRDEERDNKPSLLNSQNRLAAIAGTSTCHCVQSPEGILVDGVWGPYKNAVFPGMWMNEGGQSSTGQLIDFILDTHPASSKLKEESARSGKNPFQVLHEILETLRESKGLSNLSQLTRDLFIYPDLHGNRSPLADSEMRGMIMGQELDRSLKDLALKYLATLEAISLQTRQIVESMNVKGHRIDSIYVSGGQVKNPVLMQLLADTCQVKVQLPSSHSASVVCGSAILARFAAEVSESLKRREEGGGTGIQSQDQAERLSFEFSEHLWQLMTKMTKPGTFVYPGEEQGLKRLLDVKYKIFLESIEVQRKWRGMVRDAM